MTSAADQALERRLQSVIDDRSMLEHELLKGWTEGTLEREAMQEFARQYYHFEVAFPRYLSAIHSRTDSAAIRQLLLENLWDEEHGDRNHPRLWLDFAKHLGLKEREVTGSKMTEETRALVKHFDREAREAPVAEALATLYAFEGQVPNLSWLVIRALVEHYGFRPDQFEFFSVHLVADIAHSGAEVAAIEESCTDEEAVITATEEACDLLLRFLDGCANAARSAA